MGRKAAAKAAAAEHASGSAAAAKASARQRVLVFYSDREGNPLREFSNFYGGAAPFRFTLPPYARREDLPESAMCEFSEKAIMLTKAALMGDHESFSEISRAGAPKSCWALGRGVRGFDQELWNRHLHETAFEVVRQKFEASGDLQQVLLGTGDAILAEAARNDCIWGIGRGTQDARALQPEQWRGRNVLGFALMRARSHLRGQDSSLEAATSQIAASTAGSSTGGGDVNADANGNDEGRHLCDAASSPRAPAITSQDKLELEDPLAVVDGEECRRPDA